MVKITEKALNTIIENATRKYLHETKLRSECIIEALHDYIVRNDGQPGFIMSLPQFTVHTPVEE